MKTVGIMQPYFLPYIGYFQLINMVDEFVLYDNIQFTKKGWIHRNRMLQDGKDEFFTLPIKKDSDYLDIVERTLANDFEKDKLKIIRKIEANYKKAPYFSQFFPIVNEIFDCNSKNLFEFIFHSIRIINQYLNINTPIVISSLLPEYIRPLKSQDKVIAICKECKADIYINSSGGVGLYDPGVFFNNNIKLQFYRSKPTQYQQFSNNFVSHLSIIDTCMFNSKSKVIELLDNYELLNNQSDV